MQSVQSPTHAFVPASPQSEVKGLSLTYQRAPETFNDYNGDKSIFKKTIDQLRKAFTDFNRISTNFHREGQKVVLVPTDDGPVKITQGELKAVENAYKHHLTEFLALVNKSHTVKKTRRTTSSLKAPFYISDNLYNFLVEANLGNGNAQAFTDESVDHHQKVESKPSNWSTQDVLAEVKKFEEKRQKRSDVKRKLNPLTPLPFGTKISDYNVQASLELITGNRMATSSLLVCLFALYSAANDLQSKTFGHRTNYDALMNRYLGDDNNTRWILEGQDLTDKAIELVEAGNLSLREKLFVPIRDAEGEPTGDFKQDDQGRYVLAVNQSGFIRLLESKSIPLNKTKHREGVMSPAFIPKDENKHIKRTEEDPTGQKDDNWGLLFLMFSSLVSLYRIPDELLEEEEKRAITSSTRPGSEYEKAYAVIEEDSNGVLYYEDINGDAIPAPEGKEVGARIEIEANPNFLLADKHTSYISSLVDAHKFRRNREKKLRLNA